MNAQVVIITGMSLVTSLALTPGSAWATCLAVSAVWKASAEFASLGPTQAMTEQELLLRPGCMTSKARAWRGISREALASGMCPSNEADAIDAWHPWVQVTRMGWKLDQADSLEIYTLLLLICTCQLRRAGEAHEGTGSQQHGFISSVKVGVERIQVNFALPGVNGTWDGNPPLDVSWGCRLMMFSLVQYLVPPLHV